MLQSNLFIITLPDKLVDRQTPLKKKNKTLNDIMEGVNIHKTF